MTSHALHFIHAHAQEVDLDEKRARRLVLLCASQSSIGWLSSIDDFFAEHFERAKHDVVVVGNLLCCELLLLKRLAVDTL